MREGEWNRGCQTRILFDHPQFWQFVARLSRSIKASSEHDVVPLQSVCGVVMKGRETNDQFVLSRNLPLVSQSDIVKFVTVCERSVRRCTQDSVVVSKVQGGERNEYLYALMLVKLRKSEWETMRVGSL